jgi:hypothetical protein
MFFRTMLAAFVSIALLEGPALAQQVDRVSLSRELVTLTRLERAIDVMYDSLGPLVSDNAAQQLHLSAPESQRFGQIMTEELRASTPELVEVIARFYAENMSEQQLQETVTFLRSPAGQAFAGLQDNSRTELQRAAQSIGLRVAARSLERFARERAEDAAK